MRLFYVKWNQSWKKTVKYSLQTFLIPCRLKCHHVHSLQSILLPIKTTPNYPHIIYTLKTKQILTPIHVKHTQNHPFVAKSELAWVAKETTNTCPTLGKLSKYNGQYTLKQACNWKSCNIHCDDHWNLRNNCAAFWWDLGSE